VNNRKVYLLKLNTFFLRIDKKIKPVGWGWREKTKATPLDKESAESWERTLIGYYGKGIVSIVIDKDLLAKARKRK
jgi:hypothetical protein